MTARLWYIDGFDTHGIPGLAQVYDAVSTGLLEWSSGQDMDLLGTEMDCVRFLRAYGFKELLTDDEQLLRMWKEVTESDNDGGHPGTDPGPTNPADTGRLSQASSNTAGRSKSVH